MFKNKSADHNLNYDFKEEANNHETRNHININIGWKK